MAAFAFLSEPASALRVGPEAPHSPNAEDIATSYWVMAVIVVLLSLVLNAALIAALLRFRERRGRTAARITAGRGVVVKVAGGLAAFALAVLVFAIVMAEQALEVEESGPEGLTASANRTAQVAAEGVSSEALEAAEEAELSQEPAAGEVQAFVPPEGAPLEISAIAQQWLWRFEYPGGTPGQRIFSYGELVVPIDTAVVLNVDSTDVTHSWWVPALGGQIQAVPGSVGQTWFKADEVGTYRGQGTVFDGTAFPSLRPQVRVVEATEYEAYIEGLVSDLEEAQQAVRDEVASAAQAEAQGEETGP